MKNAKTKAVCCAGIFGVSLCTVLMGISMGGSFATAFLKDSNMQGMDSMPVTSQTNRNVVLSFFDSPWGDVLLVISSASMLIGIWFRGNMKLTPLAVSGILLMFAGMYLYYSIFLQIIGAAIMGFAHLSNYNYRISKLLKI